MSNNTYGRLLRLTTFGESHGPALGGVIDGFPAGIAIDMDFIRSEMARRRPGSTSLGTKRNESDEPEILSGILDGVSTGAPIGFIIRNTSQRSSDYDDIAHTFRPGHADYTYQMKYGIRDPRGGGRSSGRETSCRVFGGALAKLLLRNEGISIDAGVIAVGGTKASGYSWTPPFPPPLYAPECPELKAMEEEIRRAAADGDSIGGLIECRATGMIPGLGEPAAGKLDADLAGAIMSIGAVKGIEFGSGFEGAMHRGSENNDMMRMESGRPVFLSNNAGGILGGISNGNDIIMRIAVKPTPSISTRQLTITDTMEATEITVRGRHDPCIAIRAVPVAEAMAALVIADHLLISRAYER